MEIKLFRLISMTIALICLLIVIPANLFINVTMLLNYIIFAYAMLVLGMYWASCRGRHYLLSLYLLTLALLNFSWVLNGGSSGSIPFFFITAALYPVVFFKGNTRLSMLLVLVVNYWMLLLVEYFNPDLIIQFNNVQERSIDIAIGFLSSTLTSAVFFWVVLTNYVNALKDRRKAEEELLQNESRSRDRADELAALMDTTPACILISRDVEGKFITGNRTANQLMRIPPSGNLSKTAPPEQRPNHYRIMHGGKETPFRDLPIQRAVRGETISDYEQDILFEDGSQITLFGNALPLLDDQGNIRGGVAAFVDVTAHKRMEDSLRKSEEQYRMLAENMSEGIFVLDMEHRITYANSACSRMLGHPAAELYGMPLKEFLPESSRQALMESLKIMLTGNHLNFSLNLINKEGETVYTLVSGHPVFDQDGKITGSFGVFADISKHHRLEAQLQHSQKLESVGRLAGGVAHDINNKLTVIMGYSQVALSRELDRDRLIEYLHEINRAAELSRDIISQLLTFSRQQVIAPVPVNITKAIRNSKNSLTRLIGEDIAFRFSAGNDIWPVYIDPVQLDQVIMNMAVNARDAMPNGGVFSISASNITIQEGYCLNNLEARPGEFVQITFADNGIGMSAETMKNIFEPFFTTKEVGKGSGLGLATTYGIVSQNGGFIEVASELGKGTTFSIYLSRHFEHPQAERSNDVVMPKGSGTILLVEDEDHVRKMTHTLLEMSGYEVHAVASPLDAIEIAFQDDLQIDLVLTDVIMPLMSGKEMMDRMLILRPGLKSIYMSGYTSEVIARKGILEEGIHLLKKPFDLVTLNEALVKVLDRKKPV